MTVTPDISLDRRRRQVRAPVAALVAAVLLAAAACSSGTETSTGDDSSAGAAGSGELVGGEVTTLTEAAAMLPATIATAEGDLIELVLYDRFVERSGIDLPASFDGADISASTVAAGEIPVEYPGWSDWSSELSQGQEVVDDFGISWLEPTSLASGGRPGSTGVVFVLTGAIDPDAVDAAVSSAPGWSDLLERTTVEGQDVLAWPMPADLGDRPDSPMNKVRSDQWALIAPGRALFGFADDPVFTAAVRTNVGAAPSVADDELLAPVLAELGDQDAHKAQLLVIDEPFTALVPDADTKGTLVPYQAIGVGAVVDDDGQDLGVLVLANDTTEAAEANRDALVALLEDGESAMTRQPWSEVLTVESATTSGTLTVVTVTRVDAEGLATAYRTLMDAVFRRDNLYWVDEGG